MKNIIEKDNKLLMKCSLVMLSTDKKPIKGDILLRHLWKGTPNECRSLWQFDESVTIEDVFQYRTLNGTFRDIASSFVTQHLYILSDVEIEEDDWYLSDKFVWQMKYPQWGEEGQGGAKKIIITTNPELTEIIECNGTPYVFKIPKIPQSFIQEFVKNQGKGYDEVLVEMEEKCCGLLGTTTKDTELSEICMICSARSNIKLALSSNNEVNIMTNITWDIIYNNYFLQSEYNGLSFSEWLKENYNLPTKIDK